MIEKRVGVGWTINFGNIKALIIFGLFILVVIAITVGEIIIG